MVHPPSDSGPSRQPFFPPPFKLTDYRPSSDSNTDFSRSSSVSFTPSRYRAHTNHRLPSHAFSSPTPSNSSHTFQYARGSTAPLLARGRSRSATPASKQVLLLDDDRLAKARYHSTRKCVETWQQIMDKYGSIRPEDDDEIDLATGRVVHDRGRLRGITPRDFGDVPEDDEDRDGLKALLLGLDDGVGIGGPEVNGFDEDEDELGEWGDRSGLDDQLPPEEEEPPVRPWTQEDEEDLQDFLRAESERRRDAVEQGRERSITKSPSESPYNSEDEYYSLEPHLRRTRISASASQEPISVHVEEDDELAANDSDAEEARRTTPAPATKDVETSEEEDIFDNSYFDPSSDIATRFSSPILSRFITKNSRALQAQAKTLAATAGISSHLSPINDGIISDVFSTPIPTPIRDAGPEHAGTSSAAGLRMSTSSVRSVRFADHPEIFTFPSPLEMDGSKGKQRASSDELSPVGGNSFSRPYRPPTPARIKISQEAIVIDDHDNEKDDEDERGDESEEEVEVEEEELSEEVVEGESKVDESDHGKDEGYLGGYSNEGQGNGVDLQMLEKISSKPTGRAASAPARSKTVHEFCSPISSSNAPERSAASFISPDLADKTRYYPQLQYRRNGLLRHCVACRQAGGDRAELDVWCKGRLRPSLCKYEADQALRTSKRDKRDNRKKQVTRSRSSSRHRRDKENTDESTAASSSSEEEEEGEKEVEAFNEALNKSDDDDTDSSDSAKGKRDEEEFDDEHDMIEVVYRSKSVPSVPQKVVESSLTPTMPIISTTSTKVPTTSSSKDHVPSASPNLSTTILSATTPSIGSSPSRLTPTKTFKFDSCHTDKILSNHLSTKVRPTTFKGCIECRKAGGYREERAVYCPGRSRKARCLWSTGPNSNETRRSTRVANNVQLHDRGDVGIDQPHIVSPRSKSPAVALATASSSPPTIPSATLESSMSVSPGRAPGPLFMPGPSEPPSPPATDSLPTIPTPLLPPTPTQTHQSNSLESATDLANLANAATVEERAVSSPLHLNHRLTWRRGGYRSCRACRESGGERAELAEYCPGRVRQVYCQMGPAPAYHTSDGTSDQENVDERYTPFRTPDRLHLSPFHRGDRIQRSTGRGFRRCRSCNRAGGDRAKLAEYCGGRVRPVLCIFEFPANTDLTSSLPPGKRSLGGKPRNLCVICLEAGGERRDKAAFCEGRIKGRTCDYESDGKRRRSMSRGRSQSKRGGTGKTSSHLTAKEGDSDQDLLECVEASRQRAETFESNGEIYREMTRAMAGVTETFPAAASAKLDAFLSPTGAANSTDTNDFTPIEPTDAPKPKDTEPQSPIDVDNNPSSSPYLSHLRTTSTLTPTNRKYFECQLCLAAGGERAKNAKWCKGRNKWTNCQLDQVSSVAVGQEQGVERQARFTESRIDPNSISVKAPVDEKVAAAQANRSRVIFTPPPDEGTGATASTSASTAPSTYSIPSSNSQIRMNGHPEMILGPITTSARSIPSEQTRRWWSTDCQSRDPISSAGNSTRDIEGQGQNQREAGLMVSPSSLSSTCSVPSLPPSSPPMSDVKTAQIPIQRPTPPSSTTPDIFIPTQQAQARSESSIASQTADLTGASVSFTLPRSALAAPSSETGSESTPVGMKGKLHNEDSPSPVNTATLPSPPSISTLSRTRNVPTSSSSPLIVPSPIQRMNSFSGTGSSIHSLDSGLMLPPPIPHHAIDTSPRDSGATRFASLLEPSNFPSSRTNSHSGPNSPTTYQSRMNGPVPQSPLKRKSLHSEEAEEGLGHGRGSDDDDDAIDEALMLAPSPISTSRQSTAKPRPKPHRKVIRNQLREDDDDFDGDHSPFGVVGNNDDDGEHDDVLGDYSNENDYEEDDEDGDNGRDHRPEIVFTTYTPAFLRARAKFHSRSRSVSASVPRPSSFRNHFFNRDQSMPPPLFSPIRSSRGRTSNEEMNTNSKTRQKVATGRKGIYSLPHSSSAPNLSHTKNVGGSGSGSGGESSTITRSFSVSRKRSKLEVKLAKAALEMGEDAGLEWGIDDDVGDVGRMWRESSVVQYVE